MILRKLIFRICAIGRVTNGGQLRCDGAVQIAIEKRVLSIERLHAREPARTQFFVGCVLQGMWYKKNVFDAAAESRWISRISNRSRAG